MENQENLMSGEESLKIITEMINKTKINIRQGIFHLLFWGWLIFACSLSEYLLLKFTGYATPWYVWYFTIPGVVLSVAYGFIKGRKVQMRTYADKLYMWTWFSFLFAAVVLFIIRLDSLESTTPYILTIAAIPTFLSGFIIKFRPLILGGASFWLFALAAHFGGQEFAGFIMPVAMFSGYLVPGYLLKNKVDNDKI